MFNNIKSLQIGEYIEVNLKQNLFKKKGFEPKKEIIKIKSEVAMAKELARIMKKYANIISDVFPKININMTGGIDSRIILALFFSINKKPNIVYGFGNSGITNTKKEDLEINKIYAKKFNLNLKILNWNIEKIMPKKEIINSLNRYGQYFLIYGGTIQKTYENLSTNNDIFFFGYG